MRILVTGGTGFVGFNLVKRLVEIGHDVTVLHRPQANIEYLELLPVKLIKGDITYRASLTGIMEGIDVVFHVAGFISWWSGHIRNLQRVNIEGTQNIVAEAVRSEVKKFIYTSSVAAIGYPDKSEIADEDYIFNGDKFNYYAVSKREGENIVKGAISQGLNGVIVNPAVIFGKYDFNQNSWFRQIVSGKVPAVPVGGINVVDVADVVEGHILALKRGRIGERYILSGTNIQFNALIKLITKEAGVKYPKITLTPNKAKLAALFGTMVSKWTHKPFVITNEQAQLIGRNLYYSSDKAKRELGYLPTPLSNSIKETVDWLKQG